MIPKASILTTCITVLAAGSLTIVSCDENGGTTERTSTPQDSLRESTIGLSDAVVTAQRHLGGGVTVAGEFELGKDGSSYEVEILKDGQVHEVFIDPSDGRVIETKIDPDDLRWATKAASILEASGASVLDAIASAERDVNGIAYGVGVNDGGFQIAVLVGENTVDVSVPFAGDQVAVGVEHEGMNGEDEDEDEDEEDDD